MTIGVPFVVVLLVVVLLSIFLLELFIWKRTNILNRNDQNGQNNVENGQDDESGPDSDNVYTTLLNES